MKNYEKLLDMILALNISDNEKSDLSLELGRVVKETL